MWILIIVIIVSLLKEGADLEKATSSGENVFHLAPKVQFPPNVLEDVLKVNSPASTEYMLNKAGEKE